MNNRMVMIVGYPASGKSTIREELERKGYVALNRDNEGGKVIDLLPKMKSLLSSGKDVVLDNTFASASERRPFIEAARQITSHVCCQLLTTSIEEAQFNACERMVRRYGHVLMPEEIEVSKDPNMFPPAVLFSYRKRFQEPEISEGFESISKIAFQRRFPKEWCYKALILDYDDTLRTSVGDKKWPCDVKDISILPNRSKVIDRYEREGYLILGASNQSGVRKNTPPHDMAVKLFEHTNKMLGRVIPYLFCPHGPNPVSCYCRKPMPGMAIQFFHKYKLDPKQCIMVGDMTSDNTFAQRSHIGTYVDAEEFFK